MHYLQPAGYRSYLSGKSHVKPQSVFPFEYSKAPGNNPDRAALHFGARVVAQEIPVDAFLGLLTEGVVHAGENDDEAVAGVGRLGNEARIVGRLP